MSEPRWSPWLLLTFATYVGLAGCSGKENSSGANPEGGAGAPGQCEEDEDCDDGLFCNGAELCDLDATDADAMGCALRDVPCTLTGLECREEERRCATNCSVTEDADGDGSIAIDCGGEDCDDADGNRYPGNEEVCDIEDHDEDCDPRTYGVRDQDGDGAADANCCNVDDEGESACGSDCDDTSAGTHPNVPEVCDGVDNDCDGDVDDGVTRSVYLDEDGDGFGDPRYAIEADCTEQDGISENGHDCDDSSADVAPGAIELCDGIDNNCDGIYEHDLDQDGHLETGAVCIDGDLPLDDCNNLDASTYPGAPELCDGYDNDCDGERDDEQDAALACAAADDLAGAFCLDRSCVIVACESDRGDCNDNAQDGCEVDIASDRLNCGECGVRCPLGTACESGVCEKTTPVTVAVGTDHACIVSAAGGVGCWGSNEFSQLGNGTASSVRARAVVSVLELEGAWDVAAGEGHSCALTESGEVYCWGRGTFSQLGFDDTSERSIPALVGDGFESIESGGWGNCALKNGESWCWGRAMGLLDGREVLPSVASYSGPVSEATVSRFSQCALLASGRVECSGDVLTAGDFDVWDNPPRCFYDVPGQDAPAQFYCVPTPTEVPGISAATHVSGICLVEGNAVRCLSGNGTEERIPADTTTSDILEISANGMGHVCARYESGEVVCSLPYVSENLSPVLMNLSGPAISIGVGEEAACFVADGEVRCVGIGPVVRRRPGRQAPGLVNIPLPSELLSLEAEGHCARSSSGTVTCAGSGPVSSLEGALSLETNGDFKCALFFDGSVGCEGNNDVGQLGSTGGEEFRLVEVPASRQIASNGRAVCSTTRGGEVWCWGESSAGNLGQDAPADGTEIPPTPVAGLEPAVSVGLGAEFACALSIGGRVHCWGQGDQGQLGDERGQSSEAPVQVTLLSQVVELEVGGEFACALRYDGTVWCWGSDQLGQLGQGGTLSQARHPIRVPGLAEIAAISLGSAHACALGANGQVWCWGSNSVGQIGSGNLPTAETSVEPVILVEGITAKSLSAQGDETCAIARDGTPMCWGPDFQERFMATDPLSCTMTAYEATPVAVFPLCPEPTPVGGLR